MFDPVAFCRRGDLVGLLPVNHQGIANNSLGKVNPTRIATLIRRFLGQDHRGTPEAPGRVVTLIEREYWEKLTDHHDSATDRVWGNAYRIKADHVEEVKDYLDIREINGYTIHYTPFHPADGSAPFRTLVYIGTPDNDQFTGPQEPGALAAHIHCSEGPSGPNIEYLLSLEKALAGLGPESGDEHVSDLSDRVRAIDRDHTANMGILSPHPGTQVSHDFKKTHSTDEQEELEKSS
ncbi:hypothetical protein MKZ38_000382 [Zalerion maritima]|uniref:glutathione-specific gamma-glutamylcyclotransferase n=1 Tax=Zalerion maritima TaxID=339359 RepID=A0AAD5RRL9_9PEZI|nr:hypothetical protein MKZ38_000382 [Zalerion maritima]